MSLDMREMLTGDVNRLRYITRHSTSLVLHRENVAEHSYYVALYADFICRWLEAEGLADSIDVLGLLRRCLVHDLDESRTGDFQRPFKHSNETLKREIEKASAIEFNHAMVAVFPGKENEPTIRMLFANWANAKDNSLEGAIVAFADYLSVLSYLLAETSNANTSVMHHYQTLLEYTSTFQDARYNYIRPLVDQSDILVQEMIRKAGLNKQGEAL